MPHASAAMRFLARMMRTVTSPSFARAPRVGSGSTLTSTSMLPLRTPSSCTHVSPVLAPGSRSIISIPEPRGSSTLRLARTSPSSSLSHMRRRTRVRLQPGHVLYERLRGPLSGTLPLAPSIMSASTQLMGSSKGLLL